MTDEHVCEACVQHAALVRNEADGLREYPSYWHDVWLDGMMQYVECPNWRDHELVHLSREIRDLRDWLAAYREQIGGDQSALVAISFRRRVSERTD